MKTLVRVQEPELKDLAAGYLARRRAELTTMVRALEARDFEKLADSAHKVKGTAGAYGLGELSRRTGLIETAAKTGDSATVSRELAAIAEYLEGVVFKD